MTLESRSPVPITVCRKADGWKRIFPLRTEKGMTTANRACLEAEYMFKAAQQRAASAATWKIEGEFYAKGDVTVRYEQDGLHFIPNSDAGYKLKVLLTPDSGEKVEAGFTWDGPEGVTLNKDV